MFLFLTLICWTATVKISGLFAFQAALQTEQERNAELPDILSMMTSSNTPLRSADTPSNTAQHQHQPPYTRSLPLSITRTHANKISPTALLNPAAQSANCSGENGLSHTEKKQGGEESRERKDNDTHSSQRRQRASWERPGGNSRTWWQRGWRRDRRRRGPRLGRRRERTEGWRQQWRIRQVLLLLLHPPSCPRVGQPVAAQWGMSCRNNQRQKRVRELLLQSPQSEGNYFVCPVNMDLQRSTLT